MTLKIFYRSEADLSIQIQTYLKDVCLIIAFCVTEIHTVFRGLIFWPFSFIPPVALPNKNTCQI